MGRKTRVASSMMKRVMWLDEASQSVSPALGMVEDGRKKGKTDTPAVETMPKMPPLLPR